MLGAEVDFTILDQREESRLVKGAGIKNKGKLFIYFNIPKVQ
jgi:hypothetical protein